VADTSSESIVMFLVVSNPADEHRFNSDDGDGNREGELGSRGTLNVVVAA